jgi:hypothetical protein
VVVDRPLPTVEQNLHIPLIVQRLKA